MSADIVIVVAAIGVVIGSITVGDVGVTCTNEGIDDVFCWISITSSYVGGVSSTKTVFTDSVLKCGYEEFNCWVVGIV